MLTREEVVQKMKETDMLETAAKLFNLTLVAVPGLKQSHEEYLALAEHEIRGAFNEVDYQFAKGGPLAVFKQQLYFTDEDMTAATERTKKDLKLTDAPDVEIAITAIYIWLANAVHQYGDCMIEFMYFHYRITEPCRENERLKDDGLEHLVAVFRKHPIRMMKALLAFRKSAK